MTDISHISWDKTGQKVIVKLKSHINFYKKKNNYINGWMNFGKKCKR